MSRKMPILAVLVFLLAAAIAGYFLAGGGLGPPTPGTAGAAATAAATADATSGDNRDTGASALPRGRLDARPVVGSGQNGPDDLSRFVPQGEAPSMAVVIDKLHEAGIHSGLGAFPPPGTSPPMRGLAVPEDFVLPRGYVRHYQATDDGQRIAPILMFSPDYTFYDSAGRRIDIPGNRVVPPELAPPGLPIRLIEIPAAPGLGFTVREDVVRAFSVDVA